MSPRPSGFLRRAPIRWKLKIILLLTSGVALLLALTAYLVHDSVSYHRSTVQRLNVFSEIIAAECAPAMIFNDPKSALEILVALDAEKPIVGAALYGESGAVFVRHLRPGEPETLLPDRAEPRGSRETQGSLLVFRPVRAAGRTVGTLCIRTDLGEGRARLWQNLAVVAIVLVGSSIVAYVLGTKLEGLVTAPILQLSRHMRTVSSERDYSIRARKWGDDELGGLFEGFNEMLSQIQIRDQALLEARNDLERRVQERTAELEGFAYTIAHDLRAPLRAMSSFSQILMEDYAPRLDTTAQDYAARIVAAAQRMDALIGDLLAYSRLSQEALPREPIQLEGVFREILESISGEIRDRKAEIRFDGPFPAVAANRTALVQVFSNLFSNGLKFVAAGVEPRLRVFSESRGTVARIWVEDNGIGIAPEHHERIFRVFERLNRSEAYPGTGIGLAIVRKAMARMGGASGVESRLGQGSRFWIEIAPAESPSATGTEGTEPMPRAA